MLSSALSTATLCQELNYNKFCNAKTNMINRDYYLAHTILAAVELMEECPIFLFYHFMSNVKLWWMFVQDILILFLCITQADINNINSNSFL